MGALPKALSRRGHRVMVVAPRYGQYAEGWETGVRRQIRVFGGDQQVIVSPCIKSHAVILQPSGSMSMKRNEPHLLCANPLLCYACMTYLSSAKCLFTALYSIHAAGGNVG